MASAVMYDINVTSHNSSVTFSSNTSVNDTQLVIITDGPYIDKSNNEAVNILTPSIVFITLLMVAGTPGNGLVAYIYFFKWRRTTSRVFIFTLAVFDLINNSLSISTELFILFNFLKFDHPIVCKISRFTTFFMNNSSSILLVCIAVDRFRMVCMPMKPKFSVKAARIACFTAAIISLLVSWPALFLYGTHKIPLHKTDTFILVGRTCHYDDAYRHTVYPIYFNGFLTLGHVLMDVIMIVLYIMIGRVICKQTNTFAQVPLRRKESCVSTSSEGVGSIRGGSVTKRFWRRLSKSNSTSESFLNGTRPVSGNQICRTREDSRRESVRNKRSNFTRTMSAHGKRQVHTGRSTTMLLMVTVAFMLSFIPYLVIVTIRHIDENYYVSLGKGERMAYHFFLRSYLINSAVNPIIYGYLNKTFRDKCKQCFIGIFCSSKCRRSE